MSNTWPRHRRRCRAIIILSQSEDECLYPTHDDAPHHCSTDALNRFEQYVRDVGHAEGEDACSCNCEKERIKNCVIPFKESCMTSWQHKYHRFAKDSRIFAIRDATPFPTTATGVIKLLMYLKPLSTPNI